MSEFVSEIYSSAADNIEHRTYVSFDAGPATWTAVHREIQDRIAAPVVEGLRLHLKIGQVQFWDADQETVVKTLRDLAGCAEQLDVLRDAHANHQMQEACRILREAFGWPDNHQATLTTIAGDSAHKLRLLETENARLREALDVANKQAWGKVDG